MRHEAAIREVVIGALVLAPVAALLPVSRLERLVLVLTLALVVVLEFMNSAVESAVDRISLEHHPLSGLAKDYANVAVVVAVLMAWLAWIVIAGPVAMAWINEHVGK